MWVIYIALAMNSGGHVDQDYERIARAIVYIRNHLDMQPSLAEIAAQVGLSAYHFQRLFRHWAGISPKRYQAFLTVERAKRRLRAAGSILDTAYAVGLSGAGRLHDHFVSVEAMSPGEYKRGGAGLDIVYGIHPGPLSKLLIAQTPRGVCVLAFLKDDSVASEQAEVVRLQRLYPRAQFRMDVDSTAQTLQRLFGVPHSGDKKILLTVTGTNLQLQVWRALLRIPAGCVWSYQQLANAIGQGQAVRAVANAVAANPINYLIPCHRVLRANGELGGFRGGSALKQALLDWETDTSVDSEPGLMLPYSNYAEQA